MKCAEPPSASEQCGELLARAELEEGGHWLICAVGVVTAVEVQMAVFCVLDGLLLAFRKTCQRKCDDAVARNGAQSGQFLVQCVHYIDRSLPHARLGLLDVL